MGTNTTPLNTSRWILIGILMMIAFNLRMSFTAANPLLSLVESKLNLDNFWIGIFAILPIICLGIAAIFTPWLSSLSSPRKVLLVSLLLAFLGVVLRSFSGIWGLYIGMILIGGGLGVAGTVIIPIIKQAFPQRASLLMSAYVAMICIGSAFSSYISDELVKELGSWKWALAFWGVPLLIPIILWWIFITKDNNIVQAKTGFDPHFLALIKKSEAWYISIFFLFRVAGSYLLMIWLSSFMYQRGMTHISSSHVFALAAIIQIPAAMSTMLLEKLLGGTQRLVVIASLLSCLCVAGLFYIPLSYWIYCSIILGWCLGVLYSIGMQLIVIKTENEQEAMVLSSMTQALAFIVGGIGAFLGNYLINIRYSQEYLLSLYVLYALGAAYFGVLATSHNKVILPTTTE